MSLGFSSAAPPHRLAGRRDLGLLLAAALISQTGDWVLATGLAFQVYALTGSALASAATLLANQVPQVLVGSFAGVLVDRWDYRRVLLVTNALLAVVVLPLALVTDADHLWVLFAVVSLSSCLTPFSLVAEASLLPALVRAPQGLATANSINAQVRNIARLLGAALGGVVVAAGGLPLVALVDTASFAGAVALIVAIHHRQHPSMTAGSSTTDSTAASTATSPAQPTAAGGDGSGPPISHHPVRAGLTAFARDWREGTHVIARSRALRVVLAFFVVTGIGEAVMGTLFAPFVTDVMHAGSSTYGTVLAAQAVGGIIGGLLVTSVARKVSPRALFGWGAVIFGVLDVALFLHPLLLDGTWAAIVLIALVGLPGAALFTGLTTVFQLSTDERARGRVYGSLLTAQNTAVLAGAPIAGLLAGPLGVLPVITAQGALYLLAGVVVLLVLPRTLAQGAGGTGS